MARILVIDDDEIMNQLIIQWLTTAGYFAEGALDGAAGLKLWEAKPYDLIVTDIVMPEKEGLETIRIIRKTNKSIPVIAISGGGRNHPAGYLESARIFGADYTFEKPFEQDAFLAAVRDCLDRGV